MLVGAYASRITTVELIVVTTGTLCTHTRGAAICCVILYKGYISRAVGSWDVLQGRAEHSEQAPGEDSPCSDMCYHGHLLLGKTLVWLKLTEVFPVAS